MWFILSLFIVGIISIPDNLFSDPLTYVLDIGAKYSTEAYGPALFGFQFEKLPNDEFIKTRIK